MIGWHELEAAAPDLARLGQHRLEQTRVALLGTIRKDGSPRISPIEPYLSNGHLLIGAMSWSLKTRDLLRDPRCVLHSAITAPDRGERELKLYGRVTEATSEVREGCSDGWWHARPLDAAVVFEMSIEEAALVSWELRQGRMVVQRWSPGRGLTKKTRSYP
jgi:Pyridoxamine 5'-phosphate oxidase